MLILQYFNVRIYFQIQLFGSASVVIIMICRKNFYSQYLFLIPITKRSYLLDFMIECLNYYQNYLNLALD